MNENKQRELGQWMTPYWAAELLVEQYMDLQKSDIVIEPTCGRGAFLSAVPAGIQAVGVEIDPELAQIARTNSGRPVHCADFQKVSLDIVPTVAIGNPPFRTKLFQMILRKISALMGNDGRAGFILPAYFFQYASTALTFSATWRINVKPLPRSLFPGLTKPLIFALFEKSQHGKLIGFALYHEMDAVYQMERKYRKLLDSAKQSVWKTVVIEALCHLGGKATLQELYTEISPKRPTDNPWWREKVRQIVPQLCQRIDRGSYIMHELTHISSKVQLRLDF